MMIIGYNVCSTGAEENTEIFIRGMDKKEKKNHRGGEIKDRKTLWVHPKLTKGMPLFFSLTILKNNSVKN